MSNELMTKTAADATALAAAPPARNPFERQQAEHLNAGAVAIESERAVAEAQGALVIAQRYPRDPFRAYERVIAACQRPGLADAAFYNFPRGDGKVSGPTIRLAEELARCWGNINFGMRELSNRDGVSEIEAYAWDLETNTKSSQVFTVRHIRDTKGGGRELTEQRDIYELGANMGARRLRARILAILPDDLVSAAVNECKRTLANGGGEPMQDRIRRTVKAFGGRGVSVAMLEEYLGHQLDVTTPEELADLHGVFGAIKDGAAKVSDYFGANAGAGALVPPAQPQQEQQKPAAGNMMQMQDGGPAAPAPRRGRPAKAAPEQQPEQQPQEQAAPAPANDNAPATEQAEQAQDTEQPAAKETAKEPEQPENSQPAAPLAKPGNDLF